MKSFTELLRERMADARISAAELSRRSGVTKQNIGRILNATPHPITNAPATTTKETVLTLAHALNWDENEALHCAGYAANGVILVSSDDGEFDSEDIEKIKEYIELLRLKKRSLKNENPSRG